jgi:hypothetical protein
MADCRGLLYHIVDNCDYRGGNGKSDSYAHVLACNHKRDDEDVQAAYSTDPEARWNQDDGKDWEELALASAEDEVEDDAGDDGGDERIPGLVHRVYGISEEDWERFSSRQLSHTNAITSADLPTANECLELEQLERYGNAGKVPLNLGAPLAVPRCLDRAGSNLLDAARRAVDTALPRPESIFCNNLQ